MWFDGFEAFGGTAIAAGNAMDIGASVDDLKKKVVLGYGLVEVMFSCWVSNSSTPWLWLWLGGV